MTKKCKPHPKKSSEKPRRRRSIGADFKSQRGRNSFLKLKRRRGQKEESERCGGRKIVSKEGVFTVANLKHLHSSDKSFAKEYD